VQETFGSRANKCFANPKMEGNNLIIDKEGIPQSTTRQNPSEAPSKTTTRLRNNKASRQACVRREELKKYCCEKRFTE
jgi:hypothetical protein